MISGAPEGLLLLDKPLGPTSHDVVARVRRTLRQNRVGHAGTLDPAASGLLPLVLGRATRLVRFLAASPKTYEGTLRLGVTTDTDDLDGNVRARHEAPLPTSAQVLECAAGFRGRLLQVPPAVSARKVDGVRLYRLARAGRKVDPPAAHREVYRFDLSPTESPEEWSFIAEVSGGTYIRALARDLGAALGCGGALSSLRRTAIGPMTVLNAVPLGAEMEDDPARLAAAVVPLDAMPLELPDVLVDDPSAVRRIAAGTPIPAPAGTPTYTECRVVGPGRRLVGVARVVDSELHPIVVVSPHRSIDPVTTIAPHSRRHR